jgi:GNAT superfamily N-acetyltransferase
LLRKYRGQGIGRALLWDAAVRDLRAEQANFTLLVDAKDDTAVEFYRHFGFEPFVTGPRILFLPLATAARVIEHLATRGGVINHFGSPSPTRRHGAHQR